jgi:hypothetical protein
LGLDSDYPGIGVDRRCHISGGKQFRIDLFFQSGTVMMVYLEKASKFRKAACIRGNYSIAEIAKRKNQGASVRFLRAK